MNTATLLVLNDGSVRGLYTEAIDLTSLGLLRIKRASTVEFDHPVQCWRVFHRNGRCLYSSISREQCLRWEEEFFTKEAVLTHTPAEA